jgi:two-component system NarL family response regulator
VAGRAPVSPELHAALAAHGPGDAVSPREREILRLFARGHGNKAIAEALGISENTVRFHIKSVFEKLGVSDRAHAVAVAIQRGILRLK